MKEEKYRCPECRKEFTRKQQREDITKCPLCGCTWEVAKYFLEQEKIEREWREFC